MRALNLPGIRSLLTNVGRISEATGTLIRVTGLLAKIGELYALTNTDRSISLHAEVVGEFRVRTP